MLKDVKFVLVFGKVAHLEDYESMTCYSWETFNSFKDLDGFIRSLLNEVLENRKSKGLSKSEDLKLLMGDLSEMYMLVNTKVTSGLVDNDYEKTRRYLFFYSHILNDYVFKYTDHRHRLQAIIVDKTHKPSFDGVEANIDKPDKPSEYDKCVNVLT